MNFIDSSKLCIILFDSTNRLHFLDSINTLDDNSSELAGFEISKLLKEQSKLESKYA